MESMRSQEDLGGAEEAMRNPRRKPGRATRNQEGAGRKPRGSQKEPRGS